MPPLGHFSLIRFGKIADDAGARATGRGARLRLTLPGNGRRVATAETAAVCPSRVRAFQLSQRTRTARWLDFWRPCECSAGTTIATTITAAINQSLHLVSAVSFLCAYVLLFIDPAAAALIGWLVAMTSRQIGHFFFEPKGYDEVNQATHEYKEEIKVGYNLQRKVVLLAIWALSPLLLLSRSDAVRHLRAARRRRRVRAPRRA